jgi:transcription elongation factor Elf1
MNFDRKVIHYMKSLKNNIIYDSDVKKSTIKSVINLTAKFLDIKCKICDHTLVDPVGIKLEQNMRHARCGNCGYATYVGYY